MPRFPHIFITCSTLALSLPACSSAGSTPGAGPGDAPGSPSSRRSRAAAPNSPTSPDSPTSPSSTSLSDEEVQTLLDAHNTARAAVRAPPLRWSSRVASTAEGWATELAGKNCDLEHSQGGPYGENLYWSSNAQSARNVVASWTDESRNYNARKNTCARGEVCGHYTQVVWAESSELGCAMASCGAAQVWVCNYNPPGNVVGRRPF